MSSTLTRLAGMQDVLRTGAESPAPHGDTEAQSIYNVTPRPARASIPMDRRLSRKSITSLKSTKSNITSPADDDIPPLPPTPGLPSSSAGVTYSATKTSLGPGAPQQQGTWAGHSSRQEQQQGQSGGDGVGVTGQQEAVEGEGEEQEIPWGPAHPCFPHPNPHVPVSSPEHESTRVIRVHRDYLVAGDSYPQLQNVYPEILAEWLSETDFRALLDGINRRLRDAFRPDSTRAIVDAIAGVVTGFVWDDLGLTGVKRGVRELEEWMQAWNVDRERERNDIRIVPLRRTGFTNLDFVIPDPGIDVIEPEGTAATGQQQEDDADREVMSDGATEPEV